MDVGHAIGVGKRVGGRAKGKQLPEGADAADPIEMIGQPRPRDHVFEAFVRAAVPSSMRQMIDLETIRGGWKQSHDRRLVVDRTHAVELAAPGASDMLFHVKLEDSGAGGDKPSYLQGDFAGREDDFAVIHL
ncbi:MAG: hypothetical protein BWY59_01729 [Verrucomicrobia bacterium ADurb.Bin345]|nr:MAG: hypothetical protein BWY59_01729 [Verrucomicrobia bacterium ADurb.Bin345]